MHRRSILIFGAGAIVPFRRALVGVLCSTTLLLWNSCGYGRCGRQGCAETRQSFGLMRLQPFWMPWSAELSSTLLRAVAGGQAQSVSPDGRTLLWADAKVVGELNGRDDLHMVSTDFPGVIDIPFKESYVVHSAVSNHGRLILLEIPSRSRFRLIVLRKGLGDSGFESTEFGEEELRDFPDSCQRLQISSDGSRFLVAGRESFAISIVQNGSRAVSRDGLSASLSPSGDRVAYLTKNSELQILDVKTGQAYARFVSARVRGIGAWCPDGSGVLIAGYSSLFTLHAKLLAVDLVSDSVCELLTLPIDDIGTGYIWSSKTLLSGVASSSRSKDQTH